MANAIITGIGRFMVSLPWYGILVAYHWGACMGMGDAFRRKTIKAALLWITTGVVAGLVPATVRFQTRRKIIEVAGTSAATTPVERRASTRPQSALTQ